MLQDNLNNLFFDKGSERLRVDFATHAMDIVPF
jgi:hypothetical protein